MPSVQHWVAGWNQVAYGVDSPDLVMHGDSLDDAIDHLRGQLEYERDYTSDADEQAFVAALGELDGWDQREIEREAAKSSYTSEAGVTVNGRYYWVMACYTEHCDQAGADA